MPQKLSDDRPKTVVGPAAEHQKPVRGMRFPVVGCLAGSLVGLAGEFAGLWSYVLPAARSSLPMGVSLGAMAVAGCAVGAAIGK